MVVTPGFAFFEGFKHIWKVGFTRGICRLIQCRIFPDSFNGLLPLPKMIKIVIQNKLNHYWVFFNQSSNRQVGSKDHQLIAWGVC